MTPAVACRVVDDSGCTNTIRIVEGQQYEEAQCECESGYLPLWVLVVGFSPVRYPQKEKQTNKRTKKIIT